MRDTLSDAREGGVKPPYQDWFLHLHLCGYAQFKQWRDGWELRIPGLPDDLFSASGGASREDVIDQVVRRTSGMYDVSPEVFYPEGCPEMIIDGIGSNHDLGDEVRHSVCGCDYCIGRKGLLREIDGEGGAEWEGIDDEEEEESLLGDAEVEALVDMIEEDPDEDWDDWLGRLGGLGCDV